MEAGVVGLPRAGKTTLFNALTGSHAEAYGGKSHLGTAAIPDPRLGVIAEFVTTRKIVPATLRLVDIPGVPVGSSPSRLNAVLEQIRPVEAICHVVRCFDDGTGAVDPARDIEHMDTELVLADLMVAESARDKASRAARTGEKEPRERLALLEKCVTGLEDGGPIRGAGPWTEAEGGLIRGYGFITAKPVLYVANVPEEHAVGGSTAAEHVATIARAAGASSVALCASLEEELAELAEPDRSEMLEGLDLAEPAIGPLARAANAALGLTTFYTASDKEIRSWTIRRGAVAREAAGAIHSDMQRGFIRAECYHVDDLVRHRSEKAIREAGKLRSEGKQYVMQDGDVVHFLFNV